MSSSSPDSFFFKRTLLLLLLLLLVFGLSWAHRFLSFQEQCDLMVTFIIAACIRYIMYMHTTVWISFSPKPKPIENWYVLIIIILCFKINLIWYVFGFWCPAVGKKQKRRKKNCRILHGLLLTKSTCNIGQRVSWASPTTYNIIIFNNNNNMISPMFYWSWLLLIYYLSDVLFMKTTDFKYL